MLAHSEAKALLVIASSPRWRARPSIGSGATSCSSTSTRRARPAAGSWLGYEALLAEGDPCSSTRGPKKSGTPSVSTIPPARRATRRASCTHHRGACLNAISNILEWDLPKHPVYLWTLPLFHCNGWCFPWTIAARAGTNVCLRKVEAKAVFDLIREHRVTHYCGAPVVHSMLVSAAAEHGQSITHRVSAMVAARRHRPRCSKRWKTSASTSRTCTGSPRSTGRRPAARSTKSGGRCRSPNAPVSMRGRGCATTSRRPSPCSTQSRWSRCPPTARRWAR